MATAGETSVSKYRKKPIVIDAWKVADLLGAAACEWDVLPDVILAAYERGNFIFLPDKIKVATLEGFMTGGPDDMIICGVADELYPCKPDIFAATYEPVSE